MINRIKTRYGPIQLKNGFYIEVCNKGSKTGIKIHCTDQRTMQDAIDSYKDFKTVLALGEYKDGIPILKHARLWVSAPGLPKIANNILP
jgi:hypothetical protein